VLPNNSMQLFATEKRTALAALCVLGISLITGCQNRASINQASAVHVSICELVANPASYNGKLVTVTATITRLPNGNYILPKEDRPECSYSLIKVETHKIQNDTLAELESSAGSWPPRKEFDLELSGFFDANYSEEFDFFRYRITPAEIKPQSPVRTGIPLGAA